MDEFRMVSSTPFACHSSIMGDLEELDKRVAEMRVAGQLDPGALARMHDFFIIYSVYHSNAIEGNSLSLGETGQVVEEGITLAGKPQKDQIEAKNLAHALEYAKALAEKRESPLTLHQLRSIHQLVLQNLDHSAGSYRDGPVEITGSVYTPPAANLVPQQMEELGAYIQQITAPDLVEGGSPLVCAAAAHAWLAQIHPFADGNGRTARLLTNLLLMRRGYPICVIQQEDRSRYIDALEESQAGDLTPLIALFIESLQESLDAWRAAIDTRQSWAQRMARLEVPLAERERIAYQLWLNAVQLLKVYFQQFVESANENRQYADVYLNFREYDPLSFEKYQTLLKVGTAKRTWFFGIEVNRGQLKVRYMFFFGRASRQLQARAQIVLVIAKSSDASFRYTPLQEFAQTEPSDICEIGFDMSAQQFVAASSNGLVEDTVSNLAKWFFEQTIQRDFTT
ncbi:MAG: Fic family protein [Chloroflexi bacterium]|nr:Fic family protein [Chloroflexota bacterium]